jgi:hypothetical protein
MINDILAVGDSFTYGEELPNREADCYVQVLANKLNARNITNLAKPGSGNRRMVRNVIEQVISGKPIDLIIIGWASPGRMEFCDAAGFYDLWPGYGGNAIVRDNHDWRLELLEYINKHHDAEYLYKQTVLDIIMLQSFLKDRNIRYLMLTTVANEYYHTVYYTKTQPLSTTVDPTCYPGWPTQGMAEWTNGCKRGKYGHFLEEGHKQVADKLYDHIKNLGWA